jgi:hypothetical protein
VWSCDVHKSKKEKKNQKENEAHFEEDEKTSEDVKCFPSSKFISNVQFLYV